MNYLIYGQESYLIKQKINEIIKEHPKVAVHSFDANEKGFDIKKVLFEANKIDFFSSSSLIILNNCHFLRAKGKMDENQVKLLGAYLKAPNPDCTILFTLNLSEDEKIDSRKKVYKTLVQYCEVCKFETLKLQEFQNYVRSTCKKAQLKMSVDAMNLLLSRLPNDLMNFHHELEKLVLLNKSLEKEDIEIMIPAIFDEKIFNLIYHLTRKNAKEAMISYHDLSQINHEPIAFVYSMASLYRFIYKVKVLLNQHQSSREIISILKQNPYYVENTIKTANFVSTDDLLSTLAGLSELDILFKSDASVDRELAIELFLLKELKLCNR